MYSLHRAKALGEPKAVLEELAQGTDSREKFDAMRERGPGFYEATILMADNPDYAERIVSLYEEKIFPHFEAVLSESEINILYRIVIDITPLLVEFYDSGQPTIDENDLQSLEALHRFYLCGLREPEDILKRLIPGTKSRQMFEAMREKNPPFHDSLMQLADSPDYLEEMLDLYEDRILPHFNTSNHPDD